MQVDLAGHVQALRLCFGMTILFVVLVFENIRPRIKRKALRDKREAEEALEAWKKATSRSRKKSVTKKTHTDFQPSVVAMKSPEWGEDEVETKVRRPNICHNYLFVPKRSTIRMFSNVNIGTEDSFAPQVLEPGVFLSWT